MANLDWSQCPAVESIPGKLLTTDKNIRYQQNLTGRKIAFVVLGNQQ